MRKRTIVLGVLVAASMSASWRPATASVAPARYAYEWAAEATLVVAGRVTAVGDETGTLRITKALTGEAPADALAFGPVDHPECMSGRDGRLDADVAIGDDVVLFLVKGGGGAFTVVDHGYAKVSLSDSKGPWAKAPLADVERLVAAMKTAEIDARDRAMIAAAKAPNEFLRRAACRFVTNDLGVPNESIRGRTGWDRPAAMEEQHRAGVRRLGSDVASLIARENGEEPCSAAVTALVSADCAPEGSFAPVLLYARAVSKILMSCDFGPVCRLVALYDKADAVDAVFEFASDRPELLAALGASPRSEAVAKLRAELASEDPHRAKAAVAGLVGIVTRRSDEALELELLARLHGPAGPAEQEMIANALMSDWGAEIADAVLDRLASESLSKEGEDAGARILRADIFQRPSAEREPVLQAVVRRQDVLTKRLDAGKARSILTVRLLGELGTDEAMASLRRAAASYPDTQIRAEAKRLLNR